MARTSTASTVFNHLARTIEKKVVEIKFNTAVVMDDRLSAPTQVLSTSYDHEKGILYVVGSDGYTRKCIVKRMPSMAHAAALQKKVRQAIKDGTPMQFAAAGGNDPSVWFYAVK